MATDEFKQLAETLLENYLELKTNAKDKGIDTLTISFKDYLDFYIKYIEYENDINLDDIDFDDEDDDNLEYPSEE